MSKTTKLWISPNGKCLLAQVGEETILVDMPTEELEHFILNNKTESEFFIEIKGGVEVVEQRLMTGTNKWIDTINGSKLSCYGHQIRTVARLKPVEKVFIDGDFNDSYEARVRRATGKRNKVFENDNVKAYEEGHYLNFQPKDSGAHSFTEGMSDPGVKHYYEETNGNDDDDMGLKDRILKAFNAKWLAGEINSGKARKVLSEVLDELKIK